MIMVEKSDINPAKPGNKHELRYERSEDIITAEFNGTQVGQSSNVLICHESGYPKRYYFPFKDIEQQYVEKTDFQTHCPYKGNASYWTLSVQGKKEENALWGYEDPSRDALKLRGRVSFYETKVDISIWDNKIKKFK
jgi:uncharacterized protein (DUF427 family)